MQDAKPSKTCSKCSALQARAERAYQLTSAQIRVRFITQRGQEFERYRERLERAQADSTDNAIGASFDSALVARLAQDKSVREEVDLRHADASRAWEIFPELRRRRQPQQAPAVAINDAYHE